MCAWMHAGLLVRAWGCMERSYELDSVRMHPPALHAAQGARACACCRSRPWCCCDRHRRCSPPHPTSPNHTHLLAHTANALRPNEARRVGTTLENGISRKWPVLGTISAAAAAVCRSECGEGRYACARVSLAMHMPRLTIPLLLFWAQLRAGDVMRLVARAAFGLRALLRVALSLPHRRRCPCLLSLSYSPNTIGRLSTGYQLGTHERASPGLAEGGLPRVCCLGPTCQICVLCAVLANGRTGAVECV